MCSKCPFSYITFKRWCKLCININSRFHTILIFERCVLRVVCYLFYFTHLWRKMINKKIIFKFQEVCRTGRNWRRKTLLFVALLSKEGTERSYKKNNTAGSHTSLERVFDYNFSIFYFSYWQLTLPYAALYCCSSHLEWLLIPVYTSRSVLFDSAEPYKVPHLHYWPCFIFICNVPILLCKAITTIIESFW